MLTGAPGRAPVSMPASSSSSSRRAQRLARLISSSKAAVFGEGAARPRSTSRTLRATRPPQPPEHVDGHVAARRVARRGVGGHGRHGYVTVSASGRALAPDVVVTLGREHVVADHRSSRSRVRPGVPPPRRLGRPHSGHSGRSLACTSPDKPTIHHRTGAQHASGCDGAAGQAVRRQRRRPRPDVNQPTARSRPCAGSSGSPDSKFAAAAGRADDIGQPGARFRPGRVVGVEPMPPLLRRRRRPPRRPGAAGVLQLTRGTKRSRTGPPAGVHGPT